MKKTNWKYIALLSAFFFFSSNAQAQEPDPINMGKGLFEEAFKKGWNIKGAIGYQSFLIKEGSPSFSDKLDLTPNTLAYYVAFTTEDQWMESNTYLTYEIQIGKRTYSATPLRTDEVNFLNCSSFAYYFLSVPFQLSFRKPLGANAYWAFSPGVYFDLIIGNQGNELENGALSTNVNTLSYTEGEINIRPLDIGIDVNLELAVRAAYFGVSYRTGLKNLAPEDAPNMTIQNNGMLMGYVGYRFGSAIGKADADKVKQFVPIGR